MRQDRAVTHVRADGSAKQLCEFIKAVQELRNPRNSRAELTAHNLELALARVAQRGREHGDDFALTPDVAAAYFDHFEVPTPDEGPLQVVSGGR